MADLWDIRQGDCLGLLREMPSGSVDAVVTDPPYGLGFMGKAWDHGVPGKPFWAEALRVAKPGAHLLAFGGARTYHRLTCAVEDVGWEIRDCLSWLYGSGFPKSLDVSKAIDKAAGAERVVIGTKLGLPGYSLTDGLAGNALAGSVDCSLRKGEAECNVTEPATDAARQWSGWGTALKPAFEPIILARKPLIGTVATNVLAHGTGAINVDGCRIGLPDGDALHEGVHHGDKKLDTQGQGWGFKAESRRSVHGRWPANVLLDEDAAAALDEQSGETFSTGGRIGNKAGGIAVPGGRFKAGDPGFGDSGGASRFFYTAKAASGERHYAGRNGHPTVKPVDLMRWLCRLVTPPGGLVLDPFCGSGSTGVAALAEGFRFIGMEQDAEWCAVARKRIAGPLFAETQT